jgi:DNA-binding response OmpR family regulator
MKKNDYQIVLIDDNPAETHFVNFALKQAKINARLISARDAEEGLNILSALKDSLPDLLLIDINMPGTTGFDCLQQISQLISLDKLVVVIYSTSNYKVDISKASETGAAYFLVKTDNLDDLSLAFTYLLEQHDSNFILNSPLQNTLFDFRQSANC